MKFLQPELWLTLARSPAWAVARTLWVDPRGRRKHPMNIATIAFKGQNLPDRVYIGGAFYNKVKPYIPPVSAKIAGDLDIQQNTVGPLHFALSVPHLAIPV